MSTLWWHCYEPVGLIVPEPDTRIEGHAAIRSTVEGFLAQRPSIVAHDTEVVEVGDVALVRSRVTITTTDSQGEHREMEVAPTLLMRRQADGHWLVVLASFGFMTKDGTAHGYILQPDRELPATQHIETPRSPQNAFARV